jgi:hypothetical protein
MTRCVAFAAGLVLLGCVAGGASAGQGQPDVHARGPGAARDGGLDYLTKHQARDGSWGKTYTIAVTAVGCLAYLSASDEPFDGKRGQALVKGLRFLLAKQKTCVFLPQGLTWVHGQGFATLALAEAYGRSLLCKIKPDLDMNKVRQVTAAAVAIIQKNQSTSGGWWYQPGRAGEHEGSTTVCAVQALVAAANVGIPSDDKVLQRGFAYLKKCQTPEGGFNYRLGDGSNMLEGTAADVATLALMKQFDTAVMLKGYRFLQKRGPARISSSRFPYYGHFYGCMGMLLLGQEFNAHKSFRDNTQIYIAGVQKDLMSWQGADGAFALKGWAQTDGTQMAPDARNSVEDLAYSTAFATLTLWAPEARLTIYTRAPLRR